MDYSTFRDEDQLATVDGRIRQLEGEHYGHSLIAREMGADPNVADEAKAEQVKLVNSLDARLRVLREERAAVARRVEERRAAEADAAGA